MIKIIGIVLLLVSPFALSSEDFEGNAKKLYEKTHELLGISPKALAFLIQSSKANFYPLDLYKKRGEYKYFEELGKLYIFTETLPPTIDGCKKENSARQNFS